MKKYLLMILAVLWAIGHAVYVFSLIETCICNLNDAKEHWAILLANLLIFLFGLFVFYTCIKSESIRWMMPIIVLLFFYLAGIIYFAMNVLCTCINLNQIE
jgi:hypothetical protein